MCSIFPTPELSSKKKKTVIIPFDRVLRHKQNTQACIFCGNTSTVQTFKGKAVCRTCLQYIPKLFVCW